MLLYTYRFLYLYGLTHDMVQYNKKEKMVIILCLLIQLIKIQNLQKEIF